MTGEISLRGLVLPVGGIPLPRWGGLGEGFEATKITCSPLASAVKPPPPHPSGGGMREGDPHGSFLAQELSPGCKRRSIIDLPTTIVSLLEESFRSFMTTRRMSLGQGVAAFGENVRCVQGAATWLQGRG